MIIAEGLRKSFGRRCVLDNINLTISRGERVVFVGHNGSGKTTFIRCLLGLYTFDGKLSIDGMDTRKSRVDILKRVGYVPQTPPPVNMKVADLMQYAAAMSGKQPEIIMETANALNLDKEGDVNKNFMKLSGGMKQKVMISIAAGRGNDIILMDEPTSNLDPESRKIFYDLLSGCSKDTTVILTSHRADELSFLSSRIIEMDYGKIARDTGTAKT
ncbi:MAG: ABC transporter ATP-binding protein [Nitrospirae bacterium]|nr:ABC transporter ATP-binding protein [Nitrospirota bacterium]